MNVEAIAKYLEKWLVEKVLNAKAQGVVLGLSGGIDSAVVAAIAKKAFPDNTIALIMPCKSEISDLWDAQLITEKFNINYKIIILDDVYEILLNKLKSNIEIETTNHRLIEANIKPRLRMLTLYYYAQANNYLVVGTSNKSEISIGYATKYGDNAVDLQLIGDLLKKEVYQLADYLHIPRSIIEKPASAGLWKGQTDEEEIGLTYKDLDEYLENKNGSEQVINRVEELIKMSEHKRRLPIIAEIPNLYR